MYSWCKCNALLRMNLCQNIHYQLSTLYLRQGYENELRLIFHIYVVYKLQFCTCYNLYRNIVQVKTESSYPLHFQSCRIHVMKLNYWTCLLSKWQTNATYFKYITRWVKSQEVVKLFCLNFWEDIFKPFI